REFRDSATAARAFALLAGALLPAKAPGDHNQAMMELGATVCLRQNPLCHTCPVQSFCAAARRGEPGAYPRLTPKKTEQRIVIRVWCEREGSLLLHRASTGARRLAGQHELPTADQSGIRPTAITAGRLLAKKKRSITRFEITEKIFAVAAPRGHPGPELAWVPFAELDRLTLSGPHRRWIRELLEKKNSAKVMAW
ncbi:MAG: A/G-specific adenine glycosylase, partial [Pseudomonadota bacterium]